MQSSRAAHLTHQAPLNRKRGPMTRLYAALFDWTELVFFLFFLIFFPFFLPPLALICIFFGLGAFVNTATLVNCSVCCPSLKDSCLYLLYTRFRTCWSSSGRMGHTSTCKGRRGWGELSYSKGPSSQVNESESNIPATLWLPLSWLRIFWWQFNIITDKGSHSVAETSDLSLIDLTSVLGEVIERESYS